MSKVLPVKQLAIITATNDGKGSRIEVKWVAGTPQVAKVGILHDLSMAEHEVLIRHKYFSQSNILDPHTKKQVLIPKDPNGRPN